MDVKDQKRQLRLGNVTDAQNLATKLLEATAPGFGDLSREEFLWDKFVNHQDQRVAFECFRLMLSYKYGKPTEKKDVTVTENQYVAVLPEKLDNDAWRQRYAKKGDDA